MIKIQINKSSDKPLYAQIRDAIQDAIQNNELKIGDRLPTVTAFAQELKVTPTTIRRAYEDLINSGHAMSHVGRGTFISDPDQQEVPEPKTTKKRSSIAPQVPVKSSDPAVLNATQSFRQSVRQGLESLFPLARRPGLIRFIDNRASSDLMDSDVLKQCIQTVAEKQADRLMDLGDFQGSLELREELAKRFSGYGVPISPKQILITHGCQQAIALMSQLALKEQRRILCETPLFIGAIRSFEMLHRWIEAIPRDAQGPDIERLRRFLDGTPSMLYFCPQVHYPLHSEITKDRIRELNLWKLEQDAILVSDEVGYELYFDEQPYPSMLPYTGRNDVAVVGSISKSAMCGLRLGWVISSPERIQTLQKIKRAMDITCSTFNQSIALEFFQSGAYDTHLTKCREHYQILQEALTEALQEFIPEEVTWEVPRGGMQMWLELPAGYSSISLFLLAIEQGVAIVPGPLKDLDHRFVNVICLAYGTVPLDQIRPGIQKLGDAIKQLLRDPPGDSSVGGVGYFQ